MTDSTLDRWLLGAAALIGLLIAIVAMTVQNTHRLNEDAVGVSRTHENIDILEEAIGRLREAEVVQRTYLITGGATFPPTFESNLNAARRLIRQARAQTQDNAEQQARFPEIETSIDRMEAYWINNMRVRLKEGFEAARALVQTGQGRKMMAELHAVILEMSENERQLLVERSEKRRLTYRSALVAELLSGATAVAGVGAFILLLRRHLSARLADARLIAEQAERLRTTLASIGDAVITTDLEGRVAVVNGVAETLTGWRSEEAMGQPLDQVFRIINEQTRQPVPSPARRALEEGVVVGLANHTLLIARDGKERPIDDSAAPIRGRDGALIGCVLVFRDVAERRQQERALLEKERQFRTLADSIPQLCWMANADGHIYWYNRRWHDYTGATFEQMAGWGWQTVHDPEVLPRVLERWRASLTSGAPFEMVFPLRGQDGAFRSFLTRVEPIRDDAGRVVRWVGTNTDVTEAKRAGERERALLAQAAEANAKFRAFFEQGAIFAGIMDVDGTLIEPNRLSWEGCGYTREQIIGKPFWQGPWWTPSPILVERIQAATTQAASGATFRAELPYYVADGSQRVADVTIVPIKDDSGRVLFLAPTGTDITDRKRAEADRQKFVTLAENSTDFIGMCDLAGVPVYVNRAGLQLIGLESLEQARTKTVRDCFFPEDQGKIIDEFFPAVLAKGHGEIEVRFRNFKTGEARWITNKVLALTDHAGTRIGFATVSQDVTERRQLEDNLRKLATDLSEADRRKDEFLATLAHELRNPLAPIRNALQIIGLSPSPQSLQGARTLMERQLEQMVRLVDDLLDVSRITRGKLELRREPVELAAVINSAIETSRPMIDELRHELSVSLPAQSVMLHADLTRLAQVFSNLLNNSAKYMDPGGRIWLKAEQRDGQVIVSVRDQGIGIASDQVPRLFEMFAQIDRSLERSRGGLGIGLTLVKRLVEMHDGQIEARSDGLGKGAEFTVRLPVIAPMTESPKGSRPGDTALPRSKLRILIVDDNRDSTDSLAMLLRLMGNETRTAYDGQQGMTLATEFRPDVMVLDIGLPKMNGYEVCRRIRQQAWGRQAVLIAVTGWGQDEDRRRSQQAGFDHHMVKPVAPQELMKMLAGLKPMEN